MSNADELDVIVVGAGLAGLACAFEVAGEGLQVAVLERGDIAGSKNISGGRLYLEPVQNFCGELLKNAPFERPVVSESIILTDDNASFHFRLDHGNSNKFPNSVTVIMSRFLKFLADKVSRRGAMVLPQQKVDQLIRENEAVVGVKIGDGNLRAKVTVAADGVLSFLAHEAGLREKRSVENYGMGIKEIIQMEGSVIKDRFNLMPGQGASKLYMGRITEGLPGGGFIYTNSNSLSLGIVVHMKSLQEWKSDTDSWELLEAFKSRPDVAPLIAGGRTVEYGAHLIPEGGYNHMIKPGIPGLLVAGDAAGFVLNTGHTVRGMDLALVSGVLAGRSIVKSVKEGMGSVAALKYYDQSLRESFIIKQMMAFKKAPDLLALGRLYEHYPPRMVQLMQEMFRVNQDGQSVSFWRALKKFAFKTLGWRGFKDIWRFIRMGS